MGAENIRIGTCNVYIGSEGSEENLGLTIGGVELELATETQQTMVDQFGDTVVKEVIRGRNLTIRMQLAETTIENLQKVMPGTTVIGTGLNSKAVISTAVGYDLSANAQRMVLRPVNLDGATPDKSEDFVIGRVATAGGLTFAYSKDNERVYNSEFRAYPDVNGVLCEFGNPTAV